MGTRLRMGSRACTRCKFQPIYTRLRIRFVRNRWRGSCLPHIRVGHSVLAACHRGLLLAMATDSTKTKGRGVSGGIEQADYTANHKFKVAHACDGKSKVNDDF